VTSAIVAVASWVAGLLAGRLRFRLGVEPMSCNRSGGPVFGRALTLPARRSPLSNGRGIFARQAKLGNLD